MFPPARLRWHCPWFSPSHPLSSTPRAGDHSEALQGCHGRGRACRWAASWVGGGGVLGSGEIPIGLAGSDAGPPFLPGGPRMYPFPTALRLPEETLGYVRAVVPSSSLSLLKVMLGTRCFVVLGARWDFSGGPAASVVFVFADRLVCAFVSFFLSLFSPFGFGCAAAPASLIYHVRGRCFI